MTKSEVQ